MERRHRARLDAAGEAVAHDQLGAIFQRIDEGVELAPVVAVVGVGHDQIFAARRAGRGADRRAIALDRLMDDARAEAFGDLDRPVGRAIVADDDFAR